MSAKVPAKIAKEIKKIVFEEADRFNFLARSRSDNGWFLDKLVSQQNVGEKLSQYMSKAEVRTYIKDAILNRYSKDKSYEERPGDYSPLIKDRLALDVVFIEKDDRGDVFLYKSLSDRCFVVVAVGTYLKWETALRKALVYIASKPFSAYSDKKTHIMLALFARHQKIPVSDVQYLQKAVKPCNAIAYLFGEC